MLKKQRKSSDDKRLWNKNIKLKLKTEACEARLLKIHHFTVDAASEFLYRMESKMSSEVASFCRKLINPLKGYKNDDAQMN